MTLFQTQVIWRVRLRMGDEGKYIELKLISSVVLDLSVCEITFFTPACLFLCLGFLTKAGLVTHHCSSCYWTMFAESRLLLFLTLPPCNDSLAVGQSLGGSQLGQLTQSNQKDNPYYIETSWSATKTWECVWLPSQLLLGDGQGIILVVGHGNCLCIIGFSLLAFSRTLNKFIGFTTPIFSPILARDRCEWESGWVLSCQLWSTHHRCSSVAARAAKLLWELFDD